MRFDVHGGRQGALHGRHGGVDPLEGLEHVHVPIEVQINFGGAAAGDGLNRLQSLHAVDGFLQRAGDGHHHLVDGHDAVIDSDDHAREIGGGKHRDGNGERQVAADERQRENEKDDRFRVAYKPVWRFRFQEPAPTVLVLILIPAARRTLGVVLALISALFLLGGRGRFDLHLGLFQNVRVFLGEIVRSHGHDPFLRLEPFE